MILDILPNQYESLALKHHLRPWQTGILGNLFSEKKSKNRILTVNMGSEAGHTYLSKVVASSEFPVRTKIYVTRQDNLPEYAQLLFDESKVHEPIDYLDNESLDGHQVPPVEIIVIDMNGESPSRFGHELELIAMMSPLSKILLLQGSISIF